MGWAPRSLRTVLLALLLLAASAVCVGACGGGSGASASPGEGESAQPGDVISWSEAASSVGQTLTVEGPVVSASVGRGLGGAALILNIGLGAPNTSRFVAIVPLAIYRRLSADTRAQLSVALVRVSGTIIGFRGATAIVVARRADLRLSQ